MKALAGAIFVMVMGIIISLGFLVYIDIIEKDYIGLCISIPGFIINTALAGVIFWLTVDTFFDE